MTVYVVGREYSNNYGFQIYAICDSIKMAQSFLKMTRKCFLEISEDDFVIRAYEINQFYKYYGSEV